MALGSVRFFKRLIAFSLVVVLPASVIGCSALGAAFWKVRTDSAATINRLGERISSLEKQLAALPLQTALPAPLTQSGSDKDEQASTLRPAASEPKESTGQTDLPAGEVSAASTSQTGRSLTVEVPAANRPETPAQTAGTAVSGNAGGLAAFRPDFSRPQTTIVPDTEKTVYLTFDDGPSARTGEILRILDDYHIRATFFVVTKKDAKSTQLLKDIVAAGHALGMHSDSHDTKKIYVSPQATIEDFSRNYDYILSATGQAPSVFRFAGGSSNARNPATGQFDSLIEMYRRGFACFDWNASTGDAESAHVSREKIVENTIRSAGNKRVVVLLAHDAAGKTSTVSALPEIIEHFRDAGYRFGVLGPETEPILYASTRKAVSGQSG